MTERSLAEIIASGEVSIDEMGAELPADMTFEDWSALAQKGQIIASSMPWIVGDILAFGSARWSDKWEQALAWTDRSNETLRGWMQVSQAFPRARRTFNLKHSYYRCVAFLAPEKADALLKECVETSMKSDELRRRVQAINGPKTPRISKQTPADEAVEINQEPEDAAVMDSSAVGQAMRAEDRRDKLATYSEQNLSDAHQILLHGLDGIEKAMNGENRQHLPLERISTARLRADATEMLRLADEADHVQAGRWSKKPASTPTADRIATKASARNAVPPVQAEERRGDVSGVPSAAASLINSASGPQGQREADDGKDGTSPRTFSSLNTLTNVPPQGDCGRPTEAESDEPAVRQGAERPSHTPGNSSRPAVHFTPAAGPSASSAAQRPASDEDDLEIPDFLKAANREAGRG